jgi:hypothetical protein
MNRDRACTMESMTELSPPGATAANTGPARVSVAAATPAATTPLGAWPRSCCCARSVHSCAGLDVLLILLRALALGQRAVVLHLLCCDAWLRVHERACWVRQGLQYALLRIGPAARQPAGSVRRS